MTGNLFALKVCYPGIIYFLSYWRPQFQSFNLSDYHVFDEDLWRYGIRHFSGNRHFNVFTYYSYLSLYMELSLLVVGSAIPHWDINCLLTHKGFTGNDSYM